MGIGDTAAMLDAIEFCAEYKMSLLQVLPINETGDDHSPYNAISSVALDPVYLTIGPDEIPGLTQEILDEYATPEVVEKLRTGSVNYRKVKQLKMQILVQAFVNFEAGEPEITEDIVADYQQFCEEHAIWLRSYSLFRTLLNEYDGNALWHTWSPEHQSFDSALEWLATQDPDGDFVRYQRFYIFAQWLCWRQWAGVRSYADDHGVKLIGDIPFGVSRYSVDVWAERGLFDLEWSGGAPPEPFFPGDKFLRQWGQNWGIPLYNWDAHKEQDYLWWKIRVQATGSIFNAFRIDHVLGLFRIWSFPWLPQQNASFVDLTKEQAKLKCNGREAQFLPLPDQPEENAEKNAVSGKTLLEMLMEAAGATQIIAEDLGVTPPYVLKTLSDLGIPGFTIPHFMRDEKSQEYVAATKYSEATVATWGTHDHSTLRLWYEDLTKRWHGPNGHEPWLELQRLMRFLGRDENHPPRDFTVELHHMMLKTVLASPACWVIFNICDVLDLNIRFNSPGTATDSNWSQRLGQPLRGYATGGMATENLNAMRHMIEHTHRVVAQPEQVEGAVETLSEETAADPEPSDIQSLESQARALLVEAEEGESKVGLPKLERRDN